MLNYEHKCTLMSTIGHLHELSLRLNISWKLEKKDLTITKKNKIQ